MLFAFIARLWVCKLFIDYFLGTLLTKYAIELISIELTGSED
ncbi:hypothetical protein GPLA_0708 [Paraglaciecola polaris LMG 21857]|uniref:Uncharacterized protein n=1 Tax=Paraglaciecola polaris LMG 21857 TaxID=1129793 RepID=K6YFW0_9ALTE|nr:hypothetical protein GPLA_0708 [Paraglaciecola polaris LMG 21857]